MKISTLILLFSLSLGMAYLEAMDRHPFDSPQRRAGEFDQEGLQAWLVAGNDINKPDVPGGRTALFYAVSKQPHDEQGRLKQLEMIRWLLAKGALPDLKFEANNMTPLLAAARTGNAPVVDLLINKAGADIESRTKNDQNILHLAVFAGPVGGDEVIKVLVKAAKANKQIQEKLMKLVNTPDKSGFTALQQANGSHEPKAGEGPLANPFVPLLLEVPGISLSDPYKPGFPSLVEYASDDE